MGNPNNTPFSNETLTTATTTAGMAAGYYTGLGVAASITSGEAIAGQVAIQAATEAGRIALGKFGSTVIFAGVKASVGGAICAAALPYVGFALGAYACYSIARGLIDSVPPSNEPSKQSLPGTNNLQAKPAN